MRLRQGALIIKVLLNKTKGLMIGIIKAVWAILIISSQELISDYNQVIMGCLVDRVLVISEEALLVLV
jgi:hypothetical protein